MPAMRLALGRRGDYAVRAMLALATVEHEARPLSVPEISHRMAIPVRFLPHVMADLVRAGLVESSIGRTGGYRLGRRASRIDVLAVVDAIDPEPATPRCVLRGGPCGADGRCTVHEVFAGANRAARSELARLSLADLVAVDRRTDSA